MVVGGKMGKADKIEPMKWVKVRSLKQIEHDGALTEIKAELSKTVWSLRDMIEKLPHSNYTNLALNVAQVEKGLKELVEIHRRYVELREVK